MNFFHARDSAVEYIRGLQEQMSIELLIKGVSQASLIGSVAMGASAFMENGSPSESEAVAIRYCADNLGDDSRSVYEDDAPNECNDFVGGFSETVVELNNNHYDMVILPSEEAFIDQQLFTSHIEEERREKFLGSFAWLGVALGGFAMGSYLRNLRIHDAQKSVVAAAEAILKKGA